MYNLRSFTVADLKESKSITATHKGHTFEFTESRSGWTNYAVTTPCGHVYHDNSLTYLKGVVRTWADAYAEDASLRADVVEFQAKGGHVQVLNVSLYGKDCDVAADEGRDAQEDALMSATIQQGHTAFLKGKSEDANPYGPGQLHILWAAGWIEGLTVSG